MKLKTLTFDIHSSAFRVVISRPYFFFEKTALSMLELEPLPDW